MGLVEPEPVPEVGPAGRPPDGRPPDGGTPPGSSAGRETKVGSDGGRRAADGRSEDVVLAALEAEVLRLTSENNRLADQLALHARERTEAETAERRSAARSAREIERLQRALEAQASARPIAPAVRVRRLLGRARRRLVGQDRPGRRRPAPDERTLGAILEALRARPAAGFATGPSVSVVVVAQSGSRLDELIAAAEATTYRPLELLVVAAPGVEIPPGGEVPRRVLSLGVTQSSASARAEAVGQASGDLIAFLDAAALPARPDWLGCLVETLIGRDLAVVGACAVVRGAAPAPAVREEPAVGTFILGHELALAGGMPIGRPVAIGPIADPGELPIREIPAAGGICLLVRRDVLAAAGSLDGQAPFDHEDIDFCLRVRARGGRVGVDGRSVVMHPAPVASGAGAGAPGDGAARLAATWGPRLFRSVMSDRLAGGSAWSSTPVGAVIVAPAAEAAAPLVADLAGIGWTVRVASTEQLDAEAIAGADVVLTLDPTVDLRPLQRSAIRVAWIVDPEPWCATDWLDEHDLLLVPDEEVAARVAAGSSKQPRVIVAHADRLPGAGPVRAEVLTWVAARRIAVCAPPPDWGRAQEWGDYPFARDLQRALERRGVPSTVYLRTEWSTLARSREDAAIQLVGLGDPRPLPGQLNAVWIISHPERVTAELVAAYDILFVASDPFAASLRARTGKDALPLHQATDPERFHPGPGGPVHDLLYVANARPTRRRTIANLVPTDHDLGVYGRGWSADFIDPRYVRGEHVPNRDLHRWYAAARIVLNDHWDEMAAEGFITNRLYDVLASGGFVISDEVPGIDEEFDGAVVTYGDAVELRLAIERHLADPVGRVAVAARGRAAVLARHTFGHRADRILEEVLPRLAARPSHVEPTPPEVSGSAPTPPG